MSLGPLLLALASAALIVAGIVVMWRDAKAKRTNAHLPKPAALQPAAPQSATTQSATTQSATTQSPMRPARTAMPPPASPDRLRDIGPAHHFAETNADVTIVRREARPDGVRPPDAVRTPGSAFAALQTAVTAITSEATAEASDTGVEGQRWPSVEGRWPIAEHHIEQAIARLNVALAPVALQIGPAGEAGWSFKNRGYGSYRRVAIAGRSVAWLRCESNHEQSISLKVRAHSVEQALLNATANVPAAGSDPTQILEALSTCIRPAAEYAAWAVPKQSADAGLGHDAWADLGVLTTEAYAIASGALREADAELSEVTRPTWDPATGRTRWMLAVDVGRARAAAITVDLVKRSFEIASVPAQGLPSELGRRRRLDLTGLTTHALAEAIAASAWPAVAASLEQPSGDTE